MGDFNFPDINWDYCTVVMSRSGEFLKSVGANFLAQVLREPIKEDALLDLHFVTREGFAGDATAGGCLGRGNDETVEFKLFGIVTRKDSRFAPLDFRKANFKLFGELFSRVPRASTFGG